MVKTKNKTCKETYAIRVLDNISGDQGISWEWSARSAQEPEGTQTIDLVQPETKVARSKRTRSGFPVRVAPTFNLNWRTNWRFSLTEKTCRALKISTNPLTEEEHRLPGAEPFHESIVSGLGIGFTKFGKPGSTQNRFICQGSQRGVVCSLIQ